MSPLHGRLGTVAWDARRLEGWLIAASMLLVPVGWSPFPWNIQWGDLLILALFVSVLLSRAWKGFVFRPIDALVALYLLGSLVSLTGAGDLVQGGLELTKQMYVGMIYVLFSILATRREHVVRIAWWLSTAAGLLAVVGLAAVLAYLLTGMALPGVGHRMAVPLVGEVYRIKGTLHSQELLGDYLTFTLPLLIMLALASKGRRAALRRWTIVWLAAIAELCTVSHSLGGALAAGLLSTWRMWSSGWRRLARAAWVFLLVAVLIGINLVSVVSIRKVEVTQGINPAIPPPPYVHAWYDAHVGARTVSVTISYNPMGYYLLKQVAWQAFLRQPLTGIGIGGFNAETERAYHAGQINKTFRALDPHSTWWGRLAEAGLGGGITLLLLWGGILRLGLGLIRRAGPEEWVPRAVFAGLVGLLINSINVDVMNFRFVWIGFALLRGQLDRFAS